MQPVGYHTVHAQGMKLWHCLGLVTQGVGLVTIKANVTEQTFLSRRYSRYMGEFDDMDCDLEAEGVFVLDEDVCGESSINTDVMDKAVLILGLDTYGCYEEVIYRNLERLGSVAVINFDSLSPGSRINKFNFGQRQNKGNIPLLDLGFHFNVSLIFVGEISVRITKCEEENPFEVCYRTVISLVDVPLWVLNLYLGYVALSARHGLEVSKGTNPRRLILALLGFYFIMTGVFYFFGLGADNTYFWLVGAMPMGLSYIALLLMMGMGYYFPLLCGFYWYFLQKQITSKFDNAEKSCCTRKHNQTNFFKSTEFYLSNFLLLLGFIFPIIAYSKPQPDDDLLGVAMVFFTTITFVVFSICSYNFNKAMASFRPPSSAKKVSRWRLFSGGNLSNAISSREVVTNSTMAVLRLQDHLGKWLQVGIVSNLLLIVAMAVYVNHLSLYGAASDGHIVQNCLFLMPLFAIGVSRAFIALAFVQGMKGPAKVPSNISTGNLKSSEPIVGDKKFEL